MFDLLSLIVSQLMVLEDKVSVLTAGMEDVKKTLGTVKEEIVTALQDSVRNAVQEIQQEAVGGKRNRSSVGTPK